MFLFFRLLLRKEGVLLRTSAELEVARAIKEKACYLAASPMKEEALDAERLQYTLPDGNVLEVLSIYTANKVNFIITINKSNGFL